MCKIRKCSSLFRRIVLAIYSRYDHDHIIISIIAYCMRKKTDADFYSHFSRLDTFLESCLSNGCSMFNLHLHEIFEYLSKLIKLVNNSVYFLSLFCLDLIRQSRKVKEWILLLISNRKYKWNNSSHLASNHKKKPKQWAYYCIILI